jgi:hypothetical protein
MRFDPSQFGHGILLIKWLGGLYHITSMMATWY